MVGIRRSIRNAVVDAMSSAWFLQLLNLTRRSGCAIIVMHRFAQAGGVHLGHDSEALRRVLSTLRRHRVHLVDAEAAIRHLDSNDSPENRGPLSVAFTVDDGYADLVEVAAPIFAEFDCPVTGFVVPNAVERSTWFWWDRLDWMMRHAERPSISFEVVDEPVTIDWDDEVSRLRARSLAERVLKQLSNDEMEATLSQIGEVAGVRVPASAPAEYRVLGWEELRAAERRGMRFGAHSMTHPILSRCSDARATTEIVESVASVEAHLSDPVQLFCYPNGCEGDFGAREYKAVRAAGLRYALGTSPGVLRPGMSRVVGPDWRMRIPRFSYGDEVGQIFRNFL